MERLECLYVRISEFRDRELRSEAEQLSLLVCGAGGRRLLNRWHHLFIISQITVLSLVITFGVWLIFMTVLQTVDKRQNSWIRRFKGAFCRYLEVVGSF